MDQFVFTMHQDFGRKVHSMVEGVDAAKQMAGSYASAAAHLQRERFTVTNEDTGEVICSRVPASRLSLLEWSNE